MRHEAGPTVKGALVTRHPAESPDTRFVVLVVDDDPGLREALELELKDRYQVRLAPDGPRALRMVEKEKVDVVLLDILMPRMHGIEVLARLKAMRPELPVIALTAVNEAATATKMMKLGAYDYVTKPFAPEALCAMIAAAIGARKPVGRAEARPTNLRASVLLVGRTIPILATLKLL